MSPAPKSCGGAYSNPQSAHHWLFASRFNVKLPGKEEEQPGKGKVTMVVLVPLVVALFVFRALGALGIRTFSTWRASARHALAVMFSFTGVAHFTKAKEDLVNMVPKALPYPNLLVAITGIFELLGAIGLVIPAAKRLAGLGLILLLVAMFPANINAAMNRISLLGRPATPLWLRAPMQLVFIGLAWWSTRDDPE